MIEICTESTKFNTTNQRLTDLARTIWKKDWFYDLEILEIGAQVSLEEYAQEEPLNKLKDKILRHQILKANIWQNPLVLMQELKCRVNKSHVWKEGYITISKELRIEKSQGRNRKVNKLFKNI